MNCEINMLVDLEFFLFFSFLKAKIVFENFYINKIEHRFNKICLLI